MTISEPPHLAASTKRWKKISSAFAVLALVIGAAAFAGWLFDNELLKRVHPALVTMKANTAIGLMLASIAILLLRREPVTAGRRLVARAFAVIIAALGLLTLGEHVFYWDPGIDQFFFRESGLEAGPSFPGRMGIAACTNFFFLGMALLLLDTRARGPNWAGGFTFAAGIVTFLVFLYYFYGIEYEPIAMYATIALHTVIAFLGLCAAILFLRPQRGIVAVFQGPEIGSVLARRMLPVALFLPVLLGWLRVAGQKAGWYGTGFGTAMFAGTLVLIFTAWIWWTAVSLNHADERRKKVEESLRSAALFPEQNPAPVLRVARDGTLLYMNPAAKCVFKEWNLVEGQPVADFIRKLATEAAAAQQTQELEHSVGAKDYLVTIAPISDAGYVNLYWRDISDRKRAEEARANSERLLRLVTSGARVGLVMVNRRYEYLFANEAYCEVLGLPVENIVGRRVPDILSAGWSQIQPRLDRALKGERVTYELILPERAGRDEGPRFFDITYEPQQAESEPRVVVVVVDITDRKHAEEAKSRLAAIVESSDDAIISKDLNGMITTWNRGAEQLYGYTAQEVLCQSIAILVPADRLEEENRILDRIRHGERIEHFETVRRRKDGRLLDVSLSVSPITDAEGRIVGASKIARDITARKQAEAALRDAQAQLARHAADLEKTVDERTVKLRETVQDLEAFSYSIAHDMRAPLRAMQGFSTVLAEDYGKVLDDEGRRYLQRIASAATRMDRLIVDILNYSKIVRGELTLGSVNVEKLVHEIAESYPALHSDRADLVVNAPLPDVLANEAALTQVISNLLGNAVKFVADGVRPRVRIRAEQQDGFVRLWFEDNGIGIPKESRARLFSIFTRLNSPEDYEGTGIGLAIVRKAVERMGGSVGVESEEGKGSRFWVQLKRAAA